MGAVKKGKAVVPPSEVAVILVEKLTSIRKVTDAAAVDFKLMLAQQTKDVTFSQTYMEAELLIEGMQAVLKEAAAAFDATALAHTRLGGTFEHGRVAITFPLTSKRNPKWKDEATEQARVLAESKGEPFDAEVFAATVLAKYTFQTSESVKLTESK